MLKLADQLPGQVAKQLRSVCLTVLSGALCQQYDKFGEV